MKINISIDDVTPHLHSGLGVIRQCERIRSEFNNVKFTLFIPTAYFRTIPAPPQSICETPLFLSEYHDFCDALRNLPIENYEFGYHGHYHGIPGRTNNDELQFLDFDSAIRIFDKMVLETSVANLNFSKILRPPAWRMSSQAFEAAKEYFDVLALSPASNIVPTYGGAEKSEFWNNKIVFCNANPPFVPLAPHDNLEIVYHACDWDKNFLDDSKTDELLVFLRNNNCEFSFMGEMLDGKI